MTQAEKLLSSARMANQGRAEGTVQQGMAVVSWLRPEGIYEVGTEARSIVRGKKSVVLPVLEKLLEREDCQEKRR